MSHGNSLECLCGVSWTMGCVYELMGIISKCCNRRNGRAPREGGEDGGGGEDGEVRSKMR